MEVEAVEAEAEAEVEAEEEEAGEKADVAGSDGIVGRRAGKCAGSVRPGSRPLTCVMFRCCEDSCPSADA